MELLRWSVRLTCTGRRRFHCAALQFRRRQDMPGGIRGILGIVFACKQLRVRKPWVRYDQYGPGV